MPREIDLNRYADPAALRVDTPALHVTVGVDPNAVSDPRPELNGRRLKYPGRPQIYLVDQGYRRHIPDQATYNNLFRDWNGIVETELISDVPEGAPIASGTVLARGIGTTTVYFVEPGSKRWIFNPHTMDVYYFSWGRVYNVPLTLLLGIPDGPSISA
jgi:hypothetical protein